MKILKNNQYLKHSQCVLGVVMESNSERTTIDFELHGVKKFVTTLMDAELLAGEAPVKASLTKRTAKRTAGTRTAKAKTAPGKA